MPSTIPAPPMKSTRRKTAAQHDVSYSYGIEVDEKTADRIAKDLYELAYLRNIVEKLKE